MKKVNGFLKKKEPIILYRCVPMCEEIIMHVVYFQSKKVFSSCHSHWNYINHSSFFFVSSVTILIKQTKPVLD